MAGDLEEFLKRAAERRAQKQQQAAGGKVAKPLRQRPEYSDARRERTIRKRADDHIPVAEVVESENRSQPLAERREKIAKAKRKADQSRQQSKRHDQALVEPAMLDDSSPSDSETSPAEELLRLLQQPNGIRQAFLLQEILQRPEDRWS